jgi:hypothetical protein
MALVIARTLTPLAQEKCMYWLANYKLLLFSLVLGLGLLGCETVADRVAANQVLFDTLSPQDQVSVRAGVVSLGFRPRWCTSHSVPLRKCVKPQMRMDKLGRGGTSMTILSTRVNSS